jgi:hypothetical protein
MIRLWKQTAIRLFCILTALRRAIASNPRQVDEVFNVAERDLNAARNSLRERDFDWALAIAYNSMLQAERALKPNVYAVVFGHVGP